MISEDRTTHWYIFPKTDNLSELPDKLKSCIENYLECGSKFIIVDLENLQTVGSSTLGALLRAARAAEKVGGRLAIIKANDKIKKVMAISRLSDQFPCYNTESEAVRAMQS